MIDKLTFKAGREFYNYTFDVRAIDCAMKYCLYGVQTVQIDMRFSHLALA